MITEDRIVRTLVRFGCFFEILTAFELLYISFRDSELFILSWITIVLLLSSAAYLWEVLEQ